MRPTASPSPAASSPSPHASTRRALSRLLAFGALASGLASCGPGGTSGGPLAEDGPFLANSMAATRQIVVTAQRAQMAAGVAARCTMRAELFDPLAPRSYDVLASEGECKLLSGASSLELGSQRYVCAGAVFAQYGSSTENLVVCPAERAVGADGAVGEIACDGLTAGASLTVYSENEFDTDTVTDLRAELTLPGEVRITQPTNLGVVTWPASGALEVRWEGGNATSSVVTVTPTDESARAPFVVCLPRTDGQVTVPAALLQQGNLRTRDAMLRVSNYRDVRDTAEGGMSYRVSAGISASALLQRLR